MGLYYEKLIRPILFKQDPEKAHDLGVLALDYLGRLGGLCRLMEWYNRPSFAKPIELFGVSFPNAVGLAAGMDKNARFWRAAPALGFGHVEIGTVTRHRQPGNDRPRVFRYPE
ncbi:quinone-dependent dihydroorotate dehydrogenase, partial [Arthrospira platensis SPKY1]|nr:quinone-dependent dihydroorotate dehydrogenase [Arthrospira platensis SPKY1]